MSNNFGDFIKEKRIRCDYSLKYVAEIIGISNVYQSSIEAGKRPAPSYDVLMKLRDALKLNDDEFGEMLDLAAESKNSRAVAYDLADYINQNDFIHKTLRFSLKNNVPESEWVNFLNTIIEEYKDK